MIARALQSFSIALLLATGLATAAPLQPGSVYALSFRDVDGRDLATADGHVTTITLVTREQEEKAQAVADLVPARYVGDQKYRYVTAVDFQGKLPGPLQGLTRAIIRNRLDAEAKKMKAGYTAKKLTQDPRKDLFVVADFDGTAAKQLGVSADAGDISVFVFNGRGKLVARWTGVPPGDSLGKALAAAG